MGNYSAKVKQCGLRQNSLKGVLSLSVSLSVFFLSRKTRAKKNGKTHSVLVAQVFFV